MESSKGLWCSKVVVVVVDGGERLFWRRPLIFFAKLLVSLPCRRHLPQNPPSSHNRRHDPVDSLDSFPSPPWLHFGPLFGAHLPFLSMRWDVRKKRKRTFLVVALSVE